MNPQLVADYAALGVDRLDLIPRDNERDGYLRFLQDNAPIKLSG